MPVFGSLITDPIKTVEQIDTPFAILLGGLTFVTATVGINIVANFISPAFDFSNVAPKKISWRAGGMIAAVRALTGRDPKAFIGDSADPSRVKTRTLAEEARRVFRSRVANPKWIGAMQRHGYKGAFEMAATVDYLFGYDATTGVVADWMYEKLTQSYVLDPENRAFLEESNPWALHGIAERLLEAVDRKLWAEPDPEVLAQLQQAYLETEGDLESGAAAGPRTPADR